MEIKKALEKAIYYTSEHPNFMTSFEFSSKEDFENIINSLEQNIDVITHFAPRYDQIYSILKQIIPIYNELLIDKINCLYIVNRKGIAIKIGKNDCSIVAILHIDSIFSELYQFENQKKEKSSSYLSVFILGSFFSGLLSFLYLKNDLFKENNF